jgi:isoleucyl-tRNA synthetase
MCRLSQALAPWSPFVADKIWRELTAGMDEAKSVHLSDWPVAGRVDADVLEQMALAREVVTQGLASRAMAGVKVRQPLAALEVKSARGLSDEMLEIVREEVNVKAVVVKTDAAAESVVANVDAKITPELRAEGQMRDVIRHIQQARKNAGLEVDDRIALTLRTADADLAAAIVEYSATIQAETLAVELRQTGADDVVPVRVGGRELYVMVEKAADKRATRG